jgi:hypothetical protein
MSQPRLLKLSADVHKQLLAGFNIVYPSRLATEDDIGIAVSVLSLDNKSIGPIYNPLFSSTRTSLCL